MLHAILSQLQPYSVSCTLVASMSLSPKYLPGAHPANNSSASY